MYLKTDGIVLRETEYKDNDKLLTLLTRENGQLTAKARGVKSRTSKLRAGCQFLTLSEFTLLDYQGKYTVTESVPKEMFSHLREDVELLSLASYFAQVTETISQEDAPDPELLSLLLNCLYVLNREIAPQTLIKAVFELKTMCLAGYLPDLSGCVVCGREDADRFNLTQGVLQCAGCRGGNTDGLRMPLSPATLAAMRYIVSAPGKRLFSFRLEERSAAELSGICPIARVREISRPAVLKLLDVGVQGLIVPNVKTLAQVQELVNYAKYYPIGQRGFCPSRKDGWGFDGLGSVPETMRHFNGETLLFPQCETAEALAIIEDICAVDGVDGIFVGPFDLSISMGMPGQFDAPEFQAAITRIVAACRAAGKYCMFFTGTADGVVDGFRKGFDAMAYSLDAALFIQSVKRDVEDIRSRL